LDSLTWDNDQKFASAKPTKRASESTKDIKFIYQRRDSWLIKTYSGLCC